MNGDNGLHSKANAVSTAKKLAKWAAGFGVLVGVGGAMKGSSTFVGKMLLSAIGAGTLAIILGGTYILSGLRIFEVKGAMRSLR